jgi:hypothetical protein
LNLRAGDLVEVRGIDEILATLDEHGRFEGLPFMPEMLKLCGRRLRVASRAGKTCDRVERKGLRSVTGSATVHLEGVRCDGAFHDGCQALCLIFWKEAWLKRADGGGEDSPAAVSNAGLSLDGLPQAARVFVGARKAPTGGGETVYSCQATEAMQFTAPPEPAAAFYWRDVRCGNVSWRSAVRAYAVERFNDFQRSRGGTQYPPLGGIGTKTPTARLDVRPGELVQVKTRAEIASTIDAAEGKNRGLTFDREMLQYCGRTFKVLQRVEKFIDEPTGRMMTMKSDCIMLEGAICESRYHGLCPRAIYPFWREIWLERAPAPPSARRGAGEQSFVAFVLVSAFQMVRRRIFGRRAGELAGLSSGGR